MKEIWENIKIILNTCVAYGGCAAAIILGIFFVFVIIKSAFMLWQWMF